MILMESKTVYRVALCSAIIAVALHPPLVAAENFRSDSKSFGNTKMDIVMTETERRARTSIVDIQITTIGSSVGSSFFLLCSLGNLARQRGHYRYIVKLEDYPHRNQMLVGFLTRSDEPPEQLDSRLAGQPTIDLEYFAPICDRMR